MKSIDDLAANLSFTTAKTGADRSVTLLPKMNPTSVITRG